MKRGLFLIAVVLTLALAACASGSEGSIEAIPELPETSTAELTAELAASEVPIVLNVWASWCIPCRSEAPLLDRAAVEFEAEVRFIGLNVRDSQNDARGFIAEFFPDAPIEHLTDPGGTIPVDLGGSRAVPLTYFYAPGGELVQLHTGVLDERTLALQIDELLAR